jgi:transcriptional regulator with XRE-family HTH domain
MITDGQIRAARGLLGWEQSDLAKASGVSMHTIKRLETRRGVLGPHGQTRRTLEEAGVEFIAENGDGQRLRKKISREK